MWNARRRQGRGGWNRFEAVNYGGQERNRPSRPVFRRGPCEHGLSFARNSERASQGAGQRRQAWKLGEVLVCLFARGRALNRPR